MSRKRVMMMAMRVKMISTIKFLPIWGEQLGKDPKQWVKTFHWKNLFILVSSSIQILLNSWSVVRPSIQFWVFSQHFLTLRNDHQASNIHFSVTSVALWNLSIKGWCGTDPLPIQILRLTMSFVATHPPHTKLELASSCYNNSFSSRYLAKSWKELLDLRTFIANKA